MGLNVLVFAEIREGSIKRPALEAVGVARGLADRLDGRVDVVALGPAAAGCAETVGPLGADRVLVAESADAELYAPGFYARAVADAVAEAAPGLVLFAGTSMGRDLAPRLAARLGAACLSDVIEIDAGEDGVIRARRPVYSGKAYARVAARKGATVVASLRPNAFSLPPADPSRKAETVALSLTGGEAPRVRTVRLESPPTQQLDVAEAPIVVSGGRGLKAPEHFSLVRDLAEALGGAVGASRAVVDAGWIPHAHQVGQTGKVVSPKLYVACGISGAIQHLAGMSTSKIIVAINKDPDAPIFKIADYGVVGDLFEVVPALTSAIKQLRAEG